MENQMAGTVFEGTGATLELAVEKATRQIPHSQGRDFATSIVVEWGLQVGGYSNTKLYYARVVEDPNAKART
jgi:hypothetical protein